MFLPSLGKKFTAIILLAVFLFLIFPFGVFAQDLNQQSPNPNNNPTPSSHKIIPIPPPSSGDQITPIPQPNGNYAIQQAIDLGPIDDIFNGIVGAISNFTECLTNPIGCAASTIMNIIEFGGMIIEKLALNQMTANAGDAILNIAVTGDTRLVDQTLKEMAANPYATGGLIGIAQGTTDGLFALSVPISTKEYLASIRPFPQAQASGQSDLEGGPIVDIWKKVRDASYALSVLILVIIGFMIMLRWRLDPRTVVTVQNALPKIVLGLLLITFSFAIAGLMIDLTRILASFVDDLVTVSLVAKAGVLGLFFLAGAFIALLLGPIGAPVVIMVLLFFCLILAVAILIVFGILIYKLLTRYVIFLVLTMFAPFFFLFGSLPGAGGLIVTWFRRAAAALLAIPATALFVNLSLYIGFSGVGLDGPSKNLLPSPLNFFLEWIFLAPVIGLGLFFFSTKVPDIVDELLGAKQLGGRSGVGFGVLGWPLVASGALGKTGRSYGGIQQLPGASAATGAVLRGIGWGKGPTVQTGQFMPAIGPGGTKWGRQITYQTPAPEKPGRLAAMARQAYRSSETLQSHAGKPWEAKQEYKEDYEQRLRDEAEAKMGPGAGKAPPKAGRGKTV